MFNKKLFILLFVVIFFCSCSDTSDKDKFDSLLNATQTPTTLPSEAAPGHSEQPIQTTSPTPNPTAAPAPERDPNKRYLTISIPSYNGVKETLPIYRVAQEYMKQHSDVVIEIDCMTYEKYLSTVTTQLMSKTAADIVEISRISSSKLFESGYFIDLYEFINNDLEFNPDDYYMNIVSAFEYKGKLPTLATNFLPYALFSANLSFSKEAYERFEQKQNISFFEIMDLYINADEKGGRFIYERYLPVSLFMYYAELLDDYENKTAHYNTPEFKELLEKAKSISVTKYVKYTEERASVTGADTWSNAEYDDIIRKDYEYMLKEAYILLDSGPMYMKFEGSQLSIPQYPSTISGNYLFHSNSQLSVTNTCANRELAWDFLKYFIEEREESTMTSALEYVRMVGQYPINKNNNRLLGRLEFEASYDEAVNVYEMTPIDNKETAVNKAIEMYEGVALKANIATINTIPYFYEVIWPDLYLYLTNKQTVDVTLTNIQSKVEIYLNE